MSVMFGDGEVHWSNGLASEVLDAMGFPSFETAGKASIAAMKAGIERARKTLPACDLVRLEELAALVEAYERDGETHMEWC